MTISIILVFVGGILFLLVQKFIYLYLVTRFPKETWSEWHNRIKYKED